MFLFIKFFRIICLKFLYFYRLHCIILDKVGGGNANVPHILPPDYGHQVKGEIHEKIIINYFVSSAVITRTVKCTYYNQSIRGVPTQPTGRGKEHTLTGTYCFLDVTGSTQIKTEGYTVRDWGNPSMGRWMMYNVFGIDESPTSWTNLN